MKIILSHGRGGTPHNKEIYHLARTGKAHGYTCETVDDRDSEDPEERAARLTARVAAEPEPVVLMGFSMGGYTSMLAAAAHPDKVKGLFLIAPALYCLRYRVQHYPRISPTEIVHGWDDDVILYEHSVRYAKGAGATLHLVPAGHLFYQADELALLCRHFADFLARLEP